MEVKNKKYIVFWCFLSFLILVLVTQFSSNTKATELTMTEIPSDFEYDGCSSFPDGDYRDCCIEHDKKYFFGGSWQQRLQADNEFLQCVRAQWQWYHQVLAPTMWVGVRMWGAPTWPTSYRWGFGRDIY